ncbi:MAG TPA: hypothetical protein VEY08_11105, partial [Chloroflexia bacterium]|nr:hypothetical protein [Chloroflexia bacterium]
MVRVQIAKDTATAAHHQRWVRAASSDLPPYSAVTGAGRLRREGGLLGGSWAGATAGMTATGIGTVSC